MQSLLSLGVRYGNWKSHGADFQNYLSNNIGFRALCYYCCIMFRFYSTLSKSSKTSTAVLTLVMYFFSSFILRNLSIRNGNKGSTSMELDFPKQKRDTIPCLLDPFPA